MRSQLLLLVFCLLGVVDLCAQSFEGRVLDESGQGIPFANIYVPQRGTGTVTNELGQFEFSATSRLIEGDTVLVSAIGYSTGAFSVRSGISMSFGLSARAYDLVQAEVLSASSLYAKKRLVGFKRKFGFSYGGFTWANNETSLGSEFGVGLESKPGWRLEGLEMDLKGLRKDSSRTENQSSQVIGFVSLPLNKEEVTFEVNVYTLTSDGYPGEPIQQKPIYWKLSPRSKGLVSLDLSDHNLIMQGPVVITLEAITSNGKGVNLWMPASLTKGTSFTKFNDGSWIKANDSVALRGKFGCKS